MNSKWFENELNEYVQARQKARKSTPKTLVGTTLFFLALVIVLIVVRMKNPDYAIGASLGIVGGIYVFTMLIALLSQKKANKITDNPKLTGLEQQLTDLLTTQELTDEFDAEMMTGTKRYVVNKDMDQIFVTPHYLVEKAKVMGAPMYIVVRLDQVTALNYSGVKDSTKVNPLAREYYVDLLNIEGKKIAGLTIQGRKTLAELKAVLNLND